jgi:hypothetical protein
MSKAGPKERSTRFRVGTTAVLELYAAGAAHGRAEIDILKGVVQPAPPTAWRLHLASAGFTSFDLSNSRHSDAQAYDNFSTATIGTATCLAKRRALISAETVGSARFFG